MPSKKNENISSMKGLKHFDSPSEVDIFDLRMLASPHSVITVPYTVNKPLCAWCCII